MSDTSFKVSNLSVVSQRRSAVLDAMTGPVDAKRDHDLRNFLYLINSFTQLVRDGLGGPVTPQQKEYLDHVLDCGTGAMEFLAPANRRAGQPRLSPVCEPAAAREPFPGIASVSRRYSH